MPKPLTVIQMLDSAEVARERIQTFVNEAINLRNDPTAGRLIAQTAAISAHAKYPQYANKWDDYSMVLIMKTIKAKGGTSFFAGDWALVDRNTQQVSPDGKFMQITAYSIRRGINTVINENKTGLPPW